MTDNDRTFTVATDDAVLDMFQNARRRLFVIGPADELLTHAENAIDMRVTEA